MTVTEERPETAAQQAAADGDTEADLFATPGFAGALATSDHKAIGRMYILFSLVTAILAFLAAAAVALENTDIGPIGADGVTDIDILTWGGSNDIQTFFQVWSIHRTALVFFVVLPLLIGLATHIVPLQVGAPSIAFPRAAAAAFWTWLVGAGIHITTVLIDGGLGVPNNTESSVLGTDPEAVELSILSLGMTIAALMLATICIVTTVVAQRPEGMSLEEVPMFSWSMLVAGGIWLLSLPVMLANLAVIWVDFRGDDATLYGNVENMYTQLGWVFEQPQVFAFAIPVLGIIADIVATSGAGSRMKMRGPLMIVIGAFGALSFGAYAQEAFNPNLNTQVLFVVASIGILLPLLGFLGAIGLNLAAGKPSLTPHFGLSIMALLMLLAGALAAGVRVFGSAVGGLRQFDSDLWPGFFQGMDEVNNSSIATGVMNYVLLAAFIGGIAGLWYWGPKIFGRQMSPLGMLAGLALLGGTVALALPQVIGGFADAPNIPFEPGAYALVGSSDMDLIEPLAWVSFIGALLLIGGVLLVMLELTLAVFAKDSTTDDNPWGGGTLEWATASPPPLGNFESAPVVTSAEPLIDLLEEENA